jgi:hypothetical protein
MTGSSVVVNPSNTTSYTVVGSALNGCTASAVTVVTVNPLPVVSLNLAPVDTVCNSVSSIPLVGGTPAGGIYSGIFVNNNFFFPSSAGPGSHLITYNYTDVNGCSSSATGMILVEVCSGVSINSVETFIDVFPNPANGKFTVNISGTSDGRPSLRIFDAGGRLVFKSMEFVHIGNTYTSSVELSDEDIGLYFIEITQEKFSAFRKLVITR